MSNREDGFSLTEKSSKARIKEAEDARKPSGDHESTLPRSSFSSWTVKWGLITSGGLLAPIHGLNLFVSRASAGRTTPGQNGRRTDRHTSKPVVWCSGFLNPDATL